MSRFPASGTKLTRLIIVFLTGSVIFLARPTAVPAQNGARTRNGSSSAKIPAQTAAPAVAPTFYKDVLPILEAHCQSCHRLSEIGPMPLMTYEQTRRWSRAIQQAVESKKMPPWFADPQYGRFANDPSLSAHSRKNPHNPDPDSAVHWGDQTYDEMMVGFFDIAVLAGLDKDHYFIRQSPAEAPDSELHRQ
jgi:hypothetical protein